MNCQLLKSNFYLHVCNPATFFLSLFVFRFTIKWHTLKWHCENHFTFWDEMFLEEEAIHLLITVRFVTTYLDFFFSSFQTVRSYCSENVIVWHTLYFLWCWGSALCVGGTHTSPSRFTMSMERGRLFYKTTAGFFHFCSGDTGREFSEQYQRAPVFSSEVYVVYCLIPSKFK